MKLIAYVIHTIIGIGVVAAITNFAKRWIIDPNHNGLTEPDLSPGPWYCYYLGDRMQESGEKVVKSAVVQWHDGSWVWATETPEWDRDWFAAHGWEFPANWIPFSDLKNLDVELQSYGQ